MSSIKLHLIFPTFFLPVLPHVSSFPCLLISPLTPFFSLFLGPPPLFLLLDSAPNYETRSPLVTTSIRHLSLYPLSRSTLSLSLHLGPPALCVFWSKVALCWKPLGGTMAVGCGGAQKGQADVRPWALPQGSTPVLIREALNTEEAKVTKMHFGMAFFKYHSG